jgi:hypothetical protein
MDDEPGSHARIAVRDTQPLVGLFVDDDSDAVEYFAEDEATAAPTKPSKAAQEALSVIGAWSDLDWEQLAADLDRIRHGSPPTPPIDLYV